MFHAILTWLLAWPASSYDSGEHWTARIERISTVAEAIDRVAKGNAELAAFLAVQAAEESGLRGDVQRCDCPPKHCDGGLAHGPWQIQPVPRLPELWMSLCEPSLLAQIRGAAFVARFYRAYDMPKAFARLGGTNDVDAPWVQKRVDLVLNLTPILNESWRSAAPTTP